MTHLSRLWTAREGVSAVEFALISGFLVVLLLGLADFGMGFWEEMQVADAARAGAAFAVKNGYDQNNIQTAALNATSLNGVHASAPAPFCGCPDAANGVAQQSCSSVCPSTSILPGTYLTVNTQVSYRTIFAWPGLAQPITLTSSATVRLN